MKKLLIPFFIACLAVALTGCTTTGTTQNTAYKSLAAVEATTEATYNAYLAQVISGAVPTNNVPKITSDFKTFQALMRVTIAAADGATNAPAPLSVQNVSGDLLNKISLATQQK